MSVASDRQVLAILGSLELDATRIDVARACVRVATRQAYDAGVTLDTWVAFAAEVWAETARESAEIQR